MRKLIVVLMLVVMFCGASFAQKAQVFGGWQYWHLSQDGSSLNIPKGWDTNVTGLFNPHFGITADLSGSYKDGAHIHTYTFGPTVRTAVGSKAAVAGHALFGGAKLSGSGISENSFAMALGGAFDVNATKNVGIRLGQFDYIYTKFITGHQNSFRYATGLVFTF